MIADEDTQNVLHQVNSKNLEERQKYGVYYDDNYDYLKHLKCVGETVETEEPVEHSVIRLPSASIKLPSTIFETQGVELKVGLLNQAAPKNGKFFSLV